MKLVIEKVEEGFAPFGPASGWHGIMVTFGEAEGDYDYVADENQEQFESKALKADLVGNTLYAWGLMQDIMKMAKEAGLEADLGRVLLGREYFFIKGEVLTKKEHLPVARALFGGEMYRDPETGETRTRGGEFERTSLVAQVAYFKVNKRADLMTESEKAKVMRELRSPLDCFITDGTHYTPLELFYERFRQTMLKISLDSDITNLMTLVNIGNAAFSCAVIDFDKDNVSEQIEKFNKRYLDADNDGENAAMTITPDRVFVVDRTAGENDEITDFVRKNKYRIVTPLVSKKALSF